MRSVEALMDAHAVLVERLKRMDLYELDDRCTKVLECNVRLAQRCEAAELRAEQLRRRRRAAAA